MSLLLPLMQLLMLLAILLATLPACTFMKNDYKWVTGYANVSFSHLACDNATRWHAGAVAAAATVLPTPEGVRC